MPFRPEHVPVVPWSAQPVSKDDLEGLGWHRSGCPPDTGLEHFGWFRTGGFRGDFIFFAPENPCFFGCSPEILGKKEEFTDLCFWLFLIGSCLFGNVYNFD